MGEFFFFGNFFLFLFFSNEEFFTGKIFFFGIFFFFEEFFIGFFSAESLGTEHVRSWKLQENGVGGLNRKLPFLNVHTTGKKKGRCRHSPISSLKYHCLPMVHSNIVVPLFFFM